MTTKTTPAKPRLSGFCNPTLPRTDAYDPHQRCTGCDCRAPRCPCNPETTMPTDTTPEPGSVAAQAYAEEPPPMTPEEEVEWIRATAELLDEALAAYAPGDWRDAARLLYALREPLTRLRRIDADLSRWLYLHGEHGLHQHIDGIKGSVNITRGRAKERWETDAAVKDYIDQKMDALEGEIPDPEVVLSWVAEVASIGYIRKTPLRAAGLDVDDYYTSEPGTISVSIG